MKTIMTLEGHNDCIQGLKLYKNNYFVSGDKEGRVIIFDIRNQKKVS